MNIMWPSSVWVLFFLIIIRSSRDTINKQANLIMQSEHNIYFYQTFIHFNEIPSLGRPLFYIHIKNICK